MGVMIQELAGLLALECLVTKHESPLFYPEIFSKFFTL